MANHLTHTKDSAPNTQLQLHTHSQHHPRLKHFLDYLEGKFKDAPARKLIAEILSVEQHQRYKRYTLELVDTNDNGQQTAKVRAYIIDTSIVETFVHATGEIPQAGMEMLFTINVQLHPMYGFSLVITDISPEYHTGKLSLQEKQIRDELKQRGIYQANKQLKQPDIIHHVGIISPETSAGLRDALHILEPLHDSDLIQITRLHAQFQGPHAATSIERAIKELTGNQARPCVILLLRGGGDSAGLKELTHLSIAKAICECDAPIWTGIGHQQDTLFLDEIVNGVFSTPTKAAEAIARQATNVYLNAHQQYKTILQQTQHYYQRLQHQCDKQLHDIALAAEVHENKISSYKQDRKLRTVTILAIFLFAIILYLLIP